MPSVRTVESVWRFDPPFFEVDEQDKNGFPTGAKAKMYTTWLKFDDGSMARSYSPEATQEDAWLKLQGLEGEECEFVLMEDGKTKKGADRWKIAEFPGKKGSNLKILSQASGDAQAIGEDPAAAPDDGDGGGDEVATYDSPPPDPVAQVKEAFDATTTWADTDDWQVAMEVFGVPSRAKIRVAFREKFGHSMEVAYGEVDKSPVSVLEELMAEAQ